MRKFLTLLTLLLCSSAAFADDRWRVSVLAAEFSTEKSRFAGTTTWDDDPHAGVAVGIAYAPTPQWDAELTVASQTHRSPYTRFLYTPIPGQPGGIVYPVTEFHDYRVMPVDFSVTRHFLADQAIAPYVRAGVRYVEAPDDPGPGSAATPFLSPDIQIPIMPLYEGFGLDDRMSAQAGAGVRVRVTPRTAFRIEATRLLRDERSDFDPLLRYAAGVSWAF